MLFMVSRCVAPRRHSSTATGGRALSAVVTSNTNLTQCRTNSVTGSLIFEVLLKKSPSSSPRQQQGLTGTLCRPSHIRQRHQAFCCLVTQRNQNNRIFGSPLSSALFVQQGNGETFQGPTKRWFAGHNKWSKIKHKKGAKDVARSKQFSKALKAVQVASRHCDGDTQNLELQSAMAFAKSIQCPKDKIAAAIERGSSSSKDQAADQFFTLRYDAHISLKDEEEKSHNVAFIIETLTDNRNRTYGNLRGIFTKRNGEIVPTGQHDWMFEQVGIVTVKVPHSISEEQEKEEFLDQIMDNTLEWDITDVEYTDSDGEEDDADEEARGSMMVVVTCNPTSLHGVVKCLRDEHNLELDQFGIHYQLKDPPTTKLPASAIESIMEALEDDEEVTNIYHSAAIS